MKPLDPRSIDLPTLASLAGAAANHYVLAELRKAGHPKVRVAHGYVFQHLLVRAPTVTELAALLGVTQQGASKAVVELEHLGYVERLADAEDSRVRRVALTAKGRAVIDASRAARAKLEAVLVDDVGAAAARSARRALVALLDRAGGSAAVTSRKVRAPR